MVVSRETGHVRTGTWPAPATPYFIAIGLENEASPSTTSAQAHHIWTLTMSGMYAGSVIALLRFALLSRPGPDGEGLLEA